ncbi:MAG TPA: type IX secretion system membrane protein PorP/SprF [Bacteroidia bacterium]|jgi:type IX secretion system PorP/SprF family membrane protein|nr:type IX secretion system membrane protein PorP/SprF [Bacteroidia bacterium]
MKNIIKALIAMTIIALPHKISAQQDPMISQHMFSGHFINPAYAGSHDYANITALGRKQWVGFDGSPFTTFLSADMPLQKKNIGLGVILSDDRIGVTERFQVAGSFAYHLKVGEKAKIAAGIRLGGEYYRAQLTQLTVWDQNDQAFASDVNGKMLPVAGAGIYFYTERGYAGVSIPNVISFKPGTVMNITDASNPWLERHYFGTIGYAIPAGKNLDIKPSILVKYTQNVPVEFDYSLNVLFCKTLWLGGTYRTGDGIVAMTEYQATKNLRIGYAYDLSLTHLRSYNSGSHELMIAWDFVKDNEVRYRSPRFF